MAEGKIRITHLISSRPESFYGGDIVILNLLRYLDKRRFDFQVVSFEERKHADIPLLIKEAQRSGIDAALVPSRGKFDFRTVRELHRLLIENQAQILHAHGYKADFIGHLASKDLKVKKITTLHGWWLGKSLKLKFYNLLDYWAIYRFDKVIAVSEPIREALIKKRFSEDKVTYIPNGVDFERIRTADGQRIRDELKIDKSAIVIGTVGRLSKEKGHKYLLEATKDLPHIILLIVGGGPLQNQLENYADVLGIKERVIFTGFRQDTYDFIAAMDIFALPSLSEGIPLVILEAASLGKPIVASSVGGIPTVLKNKETALLVEPKDAAELSQAIKRLIEDRNLKEEIGLKAQRLCREHFSAEIMAQEYAKVYEAIIENG